MPALLNCSEGTGFMLSLHQKMLQQELKVLWQVTTITLLSSFLVKVRFRWKGKYVLYMCVKWWMFMVCFLSWFISEVSRKDEARNRCANSSQLWNYPSGQWDRSGHFFALCVCARARVCADQAQGVLALLGELVNSNFVWAGGVRHFVQMGNDLTGA